MKRWTDVRQIVKQWQRNIWKDSGQWTVDSRQQTVDSGQWTVASGQWTVDSGRTEIIGQVEITRCQLH